jgi:ribonuclease R
MNDMETRILDLLGRKDYVPLNAGDLLARLRFEPRVRAEFERVLSKLEQSGQVALVKGGRYVKSREADLVPGRIRMNRQGKGFLQPDDAGLKEIVIPESATSTALHEDRVLVRRDVRPKGLRADASAVNTGAVVRILERRRMRMVGTLQESRQFQYVVPDDPRIPHDVYVPPARDVGRAPRVGDKVVVELREWQSRHTNPEGEIVEVLGAPDAEGVDMLSVLRQYDLPLHFPREVLEEAEGVGNEVGSGDLVGRLDCRGQRVITIDPDDAKDFDDAIGLERAEGGDWRLWVHIADVSHYVKPGTALDREARRRGNSTYLVDRVIPMLPEALSNELCSLKPGVDRLTRCVEFLVSADGRVLDAKFHAAVICSQRRYTYGEVLGILGRKAEGEIEGMLHEAHELAQRIRRRRFKAGSLDLDFPETKIRLDERGAIERIEKVENDVSHQLIEEFMLLANEAVAARLMSGRRPAIYRVHEEPDERRLEEYREEVLSHDVPCGNLSQRGEVQKLLQRLNGLAIGVALKIGFLKSLMRARYAIEPLGHYGLAKERYTHFTSPIRRYADLVVHRALFETGQASTQALKEVADHISTTERNSADAERDSKDVKLFAFLRGQLDSGQPERYMALVTDVRNFGFFVDVPGLAMSGLVHLSSLEDDFFQFDHGKNQLVGRRTRRVIRLGDQMEVQVHKVDRFKKQVDFRLAMDRGVKEGRQASRRGSEFRGSGGQRRAEPQRPGVSQGRTGSGRSAGPERLVGGGRPGGSRRSFGRQGAAERPGEGKQQRQARPEGRGGQRRPFRPERQGGPRQPVDAERAGGTQGGSGERRRSPGPQGRGGAQRSAGPRGAGGAQRSAGGEQRTEGRRSDSRRPDGRKRYGGGKGKGRR